MPHANKAHVLTFLSCLYLILVVALAGYAASRSARLSLPLPNGLAYATVLLPVVSGAFVQGGHYVTRKQEPRRNLFRGTAPHLSLVAAANMLVVVYSTVVITLLGTYAAPASSLDCGLRSKWTDLFRHKDADAVRTIQQMLSCCGLQNPLDMAWPFPDKTHDARSCENAFQHRHGCLGRWRGEQQRVAGIFMVTVGLVAAWQLVLVVLVPVKRNGWLHRVAPESVSRLLGDGELGDDNPRRAIDHLPNFSRYSDRIEEESSEGATRENSRRAIENGAAQGRTVRDNTEEQGHPQLPSENEWLRS